MLDSETFEKLEMTIERIKERSSKGAAIVVEGKKDEEALRDLGISGPIHHVPSKGRSPLNSLSDLADYDEAIVLTDFDRTGEKLARFCERQLQKSGLTVFSELRNRLKNLVRKAVKDIEGISSFVRSEREEHSETLSEFRDYYEED